MNVRSGRVPEECPQEISDLISWCRQEPHERPSAKEVFEVLNCSPMVMSYPLELLQSSVAALTCFLALLSI